MSLIRLIKKCIQIKILLFPYFQYITIIQNSNMKSDGTPFIHAVWEDNKLNALFTTPLIGIAFISRQGYILEMNKQFADTLGYKRSELVGVFWDEFSAPEFSEITRKYYRKMLSGSINCFTYEKQYIHKNGSRVWVEISAQSKKDENNEVEYFLIISKNINLRMAAIKRLEDELKFNELLICKLKFQNEQLKEFANLISHNLRAPVGSMIGLIELYKSGVLKDKEEIGVFSEQYQNLTYSLLDTINTIGTALDIKERSEVRKDKVNFEEILKSVLMSLTGKNTDLDFDLQIDFKLKELTYSKSYMKSIIQNLLSNSMKYRSPERKLSVTIRTYTSNGQEIMEFIDNGTGINLEQNGRNLFGLHKTFHKHKDAKGAGLFLTRKHVEAMGGKIFAESNPIYGIKFTLIFNYHENH